MTKEGGVPGAQAIAKAIAVLQCIAKEPEGLSAAAVAKILHFPRTTVLRLLSALEAGRLVCADPTTGCYKIGPGAVELAAAYLAAHDVRRISLPYLWELAEKSRETINLAITDGTDIICIEHIESPQAVRVASWVGLRLPLHATATGKVWLAYQPEQVIATLLARMVDERGLLRTCTERTITDPEAFRQELERTRERGYAVANGELEPELVAVAAPVFDHRGDVTVALSASGPSFRLTPERIPKLGALVVDTARRLSSALGFGG